MQKEFHAGLVPDKFILVERVSSMCCVVLCCVVLCCVVLCCVVLCCVVFRDCIVEKVFVKTDSALFEIFFVSENMFTPVL